MNSIDEFVNYIKSDMKKGSPNSYLVVLNDNNMVVSKYRSYNKIEFVSEKSVGLVDYIRDICNKIVEEIPLESFYSTVCVNSFSGYESDVDNGPIEVHLKSKEGVPFSIHFSSKDKEKREWIIEYMLYTDYHKESKYVDEFEKLKDILYTLEEDCSKIYEDNSNIQELNGRSR